MESRPGQTTVAGDTSTMALAERLEDLSDSLAKLIGAHPGAAWGQTLAEEAEDLRRICSALRSLALRHEPPADTRSASPAEDFRAILLDLAESIRELATGNRSIESRVGDQVRELDAMAELPAGDALMIRMRRVVDGVRGATRDIEGNLQAMAATVADSNERVATLERDLEAAREKALYDGLTRVYNRATLDDRLRAAIEAGDADGPWCFLLADIDHFKAINDTYGHLVGDAVLYKVANLIRDFLRKRGEADLTARYGGEEFGVILPSTALAGAARIAEQIRQQAATTRWQYNQSTTCDIIQATISIGVSQYRAGDTVSTLVRRADQALYAAKKRGRNRVVFAEACPRPSTQLGGAP